jgi:transcriptional regulator with XRE-family HTH domain
MKELTKGERLKLLRQLRGLTQDQLARKSDTHQSVVSQMEKANVWLTFKEAESFADALKVDTAYFFEMPDADAVKYLICEMVDSVRLDKKLSILDYAKIHRDAQVWNEVYGVGK